MLSRRDPDTLYAGANVVFRSDDQGQSWRAISPDLTQPCKPAWLLPSGGPITHDNTNAETYCTIFALAQGMNAGTLWAGTDDGNLYVTRDGGANWRDVAPNMPGVPAHAIVASIETSQVHPDEVYVTFDAHRLGDTHPYVYMTRDGGDTWSRIDRGLPLWAYVVRQDPRQPALLFAGTEDGIYASFDGGTHWNDVLLGMNHVPVFDLQIQPDANDLIAGTHGRGFAILDDLSPLEGLARAVHSEVALFPPADAWRYEARPYHDIGQNAFVADNKPYGAVISYYLRPHAAPPIPKGKQKKPAEKVGIEIVNASGDVVRHIVGTARPGVNRVVWDLTTDPPGWPKTKQDLRPYYVFYPLDDRRSAGTAGFLSRAFDCTRHDARGSADGAPRSARESGAGSSTSAVRRARVAGTRPGARRGMARDDRCGPQTHRQARSFAFASACGAGGSVA